MRAGLDAVYPRLWRYALARTGRREWADDLAQATALRAIEKAHLFDPETHLDRWLFRMAQRVWLNELRSRKVREGGGLVPVEDIEHPSANNIETNILASEVLTRISELPEVQRVTVFLVYVEGYRYAEAAAHLDVPIGTIMSRLATARKTLGLWAQEQTGPTK